MDLEDEVNESKKQIMFLLEELELINKYKISGNKENYQINYALNKVTSIDQLSTSLSAINDIVVLINKSIISSD